MHISRVLAFLLAGPFSYMAYGQSAGSVNLQLIEQQKVEKLLSKEDLLTTSGLSQVESTCVEPADSVDYSYHQKSFVIQSDIEEVWEAYKNIRPEQAWQGKIGSFAFMYSRFSGELTYQYDEAYAGMEVGQIIFLNLKFLGGLFNLAVGHEVTAINEEEKFLQFCYLENGASEGSQRVHLTSTPEGHTLVSHQTLYRSGSEFRDEKLYPLLHGLIITEYHKSVASALEQESES